MPYTKEAYEAKKYAFVSDYARFWILYRYGGVYFDTDVEVIKPLNDIIERGGFMGLESNLNCNPGLGLGCAPNLNQYKKILDRYETLHFKHADSSLNLKTVVEYTSELLIKEGLSNKPGIQKINDIYIYPSEYFCPINIITKKIHITQNTRTIHHYMGSWANRGLTWHIKRAMRKLIPEFLLLKYNQLKHK
ncbi:glycosyltransferase [Mediterranea massiliensis]|uniref:glycosyltransferase n=1 Tax=Mediterranea massiliensis TaxID=1841865 RepID=UPI0029372FC5|nr:glycosyltransferase [Mediterranea massiliensis]